MTTGNLIWLLTPRRYRWRVGVGCPARRGHPHATSLRSGVCWCCSPPAMRTCHGHVPVQLLGLHSTCTATFEVVAREQMQFGAKDSSCKGSALRARHLMLPLSASTHSNGYPCAREYGECTDALARVNTVRPPRNAVPCRLSNLVVAFAPRGRKSEHRCSSIPILHATLPPSPRRSLILMPSPIAATLAHTQPLSKRVATWFSRPSGHDALAVPPPFPQIPPPLAPKDQSDCCPHPHTPRVPTHPVAGSLSR